MPTTHSNGTPAYKRIRAAILKRIDAGQLKAGDPVGSERELARIHKVSLMTARHALATLEKEGTVERRRGAGTFVAPPKIHFNKLMSYTEQMASRGLAACSRLLCNKVVDDAPDIAARLALPLNSRMIKVERLRHAANEPFALEACYLSADDFAGLIRAPLERGSLFSILARDYGLEVAHADEEVDATAADSRTGELLALQRGAPLLQDPASHLRNQRQTDGLHAGPVSLRSSHPVDPPIPQRNMMSSDLGRRTSGVRQTSLSRSESLTPDVRLYMFVTRTILAVALSHRRRHLLLAPATSATPHAPHAIRKRWMHSCALLTIALRRPRTGIP